MNLDNGKSAQGQTQDSNRARIVRLGVKIRFKQTDFGIKRAGIGYRHTIHLLN